MKRFTGISDPYERPGDAAVVIDTTDRSAEEAAHQIILRLERDGYLGPSHPVVTPTRVCWSSRLGWFQIATFSGATVPSRPGLPIALVTLGILTPGEARGAVDLDVILVIASR